MAEIKPILVACCGNPLAGDDAFGHLVAMRLLRDPPPGCEILDLATNPASLLDHLEGRRVLIIVDAAEPGHGEAGELFECDWRDPNRPAFINQSDLSTHGLSITQQLELAQSLGVLPEVVRIIAMTITSAQVYAKSDAKVLEQSAAASRRVAELAGWLA